MTSTATATATATATIEEVEAAVRPHLKLLPAGTDLAPDQSLGEAGLDSMASIDLLLELESRFGIAIDDDLLTENSFSTLDAVHRLVLDSAPA